MRVGSLFSGIGGIDLGLERAGMTVAWQSEVDPYASKVLGKHWPGVPNLGDVTKVDWGSVERPDVVAGGFPCQPVSVAGRGLAQSDPRWMWPAFACAVRDLRPRFVLVENVPGLLVRGMGDVLGDLASLGYDCEWAGIPAAAVGAPHLRWRVFVVAHADGRGHVRDDSDTPSPGSELRDAAFGDARPSCPPPAHVAHPDRAGQREQRGARPVFAEHPPIERSGWWSVEPGMGRMAHGVPARVDRLRCLGNAVVPQVAELVGRRIMGVAA